MFESAELGHCIDKKRYDAEVPVLREALLDVQYALAEQAHFPVILLVGGVDGAGKGEVVNLLNAWMDPRHIRVHALAEPTDEESSRPMMWRFWRALPPKGKIGVFFGSWYTHPMMQRMQGNIKGAELDQCIDEITSFERMITYEGGLIIKLWLHLSKKVQKKRLTKLAENPDTSWRVTDTDWQHLKLHDEFIKVAEHVLRETNTAEAPWIVIESSDFRFRNLTTGNYLLEAIRKRLATPSPLSPVGVPPLPPALDDKTLLSSLDFSLSLGKKPYQQQLAKYQGELNLLMRHAKFRNKSLIAVFEGLDAAGKGSAIRRISQALDARHYRIIPVAAPSDEELAQPYLWRFWRHVPGNGEFTIFDRSWYGRVLVERVDELCHEADWMRAYKEINDFEAQLIAHDTIIVKFWLAITREEQLKRFHAREEVGYKQFKITGDDWHNRDNWQQFDHAVCDMVDRTSTDIAPWTLVEANDKRFARIKLLKTLCERIEQALD
ncbi:MAG: polyphosphate:AMP phosphotransferase [Zetaproteobacteria bacterium CG23_combo_of_CG06-09_8_20_14_all_54_7]|nr:MAG: polyphosphate:AMP phosphotransferase [Zetaproteobacteria bacterium CG23_combo_of_CG06-09_8_20_14_all_54_7]